MMIKHKEFEFCFTDNYETLLNMLAARVSARLMVAPTNRDAKAYQLVLQDIADLRAGYEGALKQMREFEERTL
jgi:hypothetical protein